MTRADKHMATIHDVPTNDLIEKMSKELEKVPAVQAPAWAPFVKTGASRELPPSRKDWWHVRAASVLRKVALKGPIGFQLRVQYGGRRTVVSGPRNSSRVRLSPVVFFNSLKATLSNRQR